MTWRMMPVRSSENAASEVRASLTAAGPGSTVPRTGLGLVSSGPRAGGTRGRRRRPGSLVSEHRRQGWTPVAAGDAGGAERYDGVLSDPRDDRVTGPRGNGGGEDVQVAGGSTSDDGGTTNRPPDPLPAPAARAPRRACTAPRPGKSTALAGLHVVRGLPPADGAGILVPVRLGEPRAEHFAGCSPSPPDPWLSW